MRGDNPVKGIQRYHKERRERWLSDTELKRLLGILAMHPNRRAANAVRLQLLTGARIGKVLAARWSEIDFDRGVWTKPSHHTKQKRTQHLPLSAPAMALLADWRAATALEEAHLFPGDVPGSHCRTSRTSGAASPRLQTCLDTGSTTIGTPMPRIWYPVASAWRSSVGFT